MTFIIGTPHTHCCGNLDAHTGGEGSRHIQADMQSCTHCQKAINLQEWKVNGAWCAKCQAPVCAEGPCAERTEKYGCIPFMKALEEQFELQGKLQHFRRLAGLDP